MLKTMKRMKVLCAAALAVCVLGTAASASAYVAIWEPYTEQYVGQLVSTRCGTGPSAFADRTVIGWDSNGFGVTVQGRLKDTGRCDGHVAGVYALLIYRDGTNSGWKKVYETGNETSFENFSRVFSPSKRTSQVYLMACRYSSSTGLTLCSPWRLFYNRF